MTREIAFTEDGRLEPGDHVMTLAQLRESILVEGPIPPPQGWDRSWRRMLVSNLEVLSTQLWSAGIDDVFVDGSFASAKPHPNDIDGYFVCDLRDFASGHLQRQLDDLDEGIWTWDADARTPGDGKLQLPMWHHYRVELYPHYGQGSGITDPHGNEQEFPAAFRKERGTFKPRGIVRIRKEEPG